MPAPVAFDYAVFRVVPRVEREEFVNAGVIVHCPEQRFLDARIVVDEARWMALWPGLDAEDVRRRLQAIPLICAGGPQSGPIGQLPPRERFHWLVSPRSTVIQVSPVHSGVCVSAQSALERLAAEMLELPRAQ